MHIIRHGQRVEVDDNYVLRSGEALALSPLFMDHATRTARASAGLTDSDAALVCDAFGAPAGHTRGFVFVADSATRQRAVDAIAAAQDAAAIAYEQRNEWLQSAWRRGHEDHDQDGGRDQKPAPRSLADAKQRAEDAYADKIERLKNAWKEGRDVA